MNNSAISQAVKYSIHDSIEGSVWASVWYSVLKSVSTSVRSFVGYSARNFVWDRSSVADFVEDVTIDYFKQKNEL